jgi:hypothetical protein
MEASETRIFDQGIALLESEVLTREFEMLGVFVEDHHCVQPVDGSHYIIF